MKKNKKRKIVRGKYFLQYTPKTVSIYPSLQGIDMGVLKLIETGHFYSNWLNRAGYRASSILIIKNNCRLYIIIFYVFESSR